MPEHGDPSATASATSLGSNIAASSDPTADPSATAAPSSSGSFASSVRRGSDRYDILGEHGRGGLGRVSRAHDRELDRDVAIKELLHRNHVSEVRFFREALITARLEHPGIVPIHEAGRWSDGTPYYAMKLVAGRPLRDLIAERDTVAQRLELLHHVIAVADALAYAHGRNIIHRDLKPANVIVGDFGETVVIDWGLAKDLGVSDEPSLPGIATGSPNSDLTVTGSVLGTPAYMAPEQERGERVDQRADVFAIGAMLWELCSLQKVPPTDRAERHRRLRRSSIDHDLVAILDKSIDNDPAGRYLNAGALAADLKAFKAGTRIAARDYSLPALLTHWIRRHRALTTAFGTMIVILSIGVGIYIHDVSTERDHVTSARSALAREHAELILKHAQLLLNTDPSASIDELAGYTGDNRDRERQIRAEAEGIGVALARAKPHRSAIRWGIGESSGSVLTLSTDGTITRTNLSGSSSIIVNGASLRGRFAFNSTRGLLAYGCDPVGLCIWDTRYNIKRANTEAFQTFELASIGISPTGAQLAVLTYAGELIIFDIADVDHPVELRRTTVDGSALLFVDDETIVVGSENGIQFASSRGKIERLDLPEGVVWEIDTEDHLLVAATVVTGRGWIFDGRKGRQIAQVNLCQGPASSLRRLPNTHLIAYTCQDGTLGTWDLHRGETSPLAHVDGHPHLLSVDESASFLATDGSNGALNVFDLHTGLLTVYRGHADRLTTIVPPTPDFPFFASGDISGNVRIWPKPIRVAHVAVNIHTPFKSAAFMQQTSSIIATSFKPELTVVSNDTFTGYTPHQDNLISFALSYNDEFLATYGPRSTVELWSTNPMKRERVIDTAHGQVSQLSFTASNTEFITAGRDGKLLRWHDKSVELLATFDRPVSSFAAMDNTTIVATSDGTLWRADAKHRIALLQREHGAILHLAPLSATHEILIIYANGTIITLDSKSWLTRVTQDIGAKVIDFAASNDGSVMALIADDGTIRVADVRAVSNIAWSTIELRARKIALTNDHLLLAIGSDNIAHACKLNYQKWLSLPLGVSDLLLVAISENQRSAAFFDSDGRVIWTDLEQVRTQLDKQR